MIRQDKNLLLLGILKSHQSHGYELQALLSSPLAPIPIGKANAYQILSRFEDNGWVTVSEEREGNRPPRRVYSLTASGEDAFMQFLQERLSTHIPAIQADSVSLNFLPLLPATEAVALLSKRLDDVQQRLDNLRDCVDADAEAHYGVNYMLDHAQFERDWLRDLIEKLTIQVQETDSAPPPDSGA